MTPDDTNCGLSRSISCRLLTRSRIDINHYRSTNCRRSGDMVRCYDSSCQGVYVEASGWPLLLPSADAQLFRHMPPRAHELRPTQWLHSERAMGRKLESYIRSNTDTVRMRPPPLRDYPNRRIHAVHQCVVPFLVPACSPILMSRSG